MSRFVRSRRGRDDCFELRAELCASPLVGRFALGGAWAQAMAAANATTSSDAARFMDLVWARINSLPQCQTKQAGVGAVSSAAKKRDRTKTSGLCARGKSSG